MYWSLLALAGASFSILAGKRCLERRTSVHLCMFLIFTVFTLSCACILIVWEIGGAADSLMPIWASATILIGLLTSVVIYRHFFLLVGDHGGISMEGGVILMVVGMMTLISEDYRWLPLIGMISLTAMILGYVRLETLLHIR